MIRAAAILLMSFTLAHCPKPVDAAYTAQRNIVYRDVPGVDPNLVNMDLYVPDPIPAQPIPVVLFVHGGGWAIGDKAVQMQYKPALFTNAGYCFVSVNYRLSPRPAELDNPNRIMYPVHEQDVAASVAWVHNHVAEYGGDPARIALIGHSAGAHLVNLISVDESYLAKYGLGLSALRGTIVLDTGGYDIATVMKHTSLPLYRNAFGDDPAIWAAASPMNHVAAGKGIPPMLLVTRGLAWRMEECRNFAKAISDAGGSAKVLEAEGYSHADVNRKLGEPGEEVVTPAVMQFLQTSFNH